MKTSDLIGPALDWAVAKASGLLPHITFDFESTHPLILSRIEPYGPSFIWAQGGPIIEREVCNVYVDIDKDWYAVSNCGRAIFGKGPTPLIAAMRCFVASKLGDGIEVPEELL